MVFWVKSALKSLRIFWTLSKKRERLWLLIPGGGVQVGKETSSQTVVFFLFWNPGLGTQPRRQWHAYEPTVLVQMVEL